VGVLLLLLLNFPDLPSLFSVCQKLSELSLYTLGPIGALADKAKAVGDIAIMPLGAGGPGANLMAITSKGSGGIKYLSEFLANVDTEQGRETGGGGSAGGITRMDPAVARDITSGKVDGRVKGWMPFTVSDAPYRVHWSMSGPAGWDRSLKARAAALSDAMLRAVPKPPQSKWYDQKTGAFTDEK
jgi:hypothetical protein